MLEWDTVRSAETSIFFEALGGNAAKTTEQYLHKPLLWVKNGKAPYALTQVGGLLLREENQ